MNNSKNPLTKEELFFENLVDKIKTESSTLKNIKMLEKAFYDYHWYNKKPTKIIVTIKDFIKRLKIISK